jgi:uroporphyrinogen III methyltransferase/synthase
VIREDNETEPAARRGGYAYLVGAGPGDPGLLTLRGRECLQQAEVVLYDRLACEELLSWAPADAELIGVGKAPGAHSATQDEINALLVEKTRGGRVVVRLKGGDPFLLGRGGEEALALREHGLPFEVVPGVTSAIAAPEMAGIPVTHRGLAASVAVVTGHEGEGRPSGGVDWERLAGAVDTIVILMGVGNFGLIRDRLVSGGLPAETPVAFVERGTTPRQRSVHTTLGAAVADAEAAGVAAPSVIVVGKVAALGRELNWFERLPLQGKTILLTRPLAQAGELSDMLRRSGAEPVVIPAIEIAPPEDFGPLDDLLRQASGADWLVFTSTNAVAAVVSRLWDLGLDLRALAGPRLAAVGARTAQSLEEHLLRVDLIPAEYTTEALAQALIAPGVAGKKVLIPRSAQGTELLREELCQAGAEVLVAPAYRTLPVTGNAERLREAVRCGPPDAVVLTSSSCVHSFVRAVGPGGLAALRGRAVIACIGAVTAETARACGLEPTVVATESSAAGIHGALVAAFCVGAQ